MFLINLNTEIVACILSFRKSRHKPNLENTTKYGFSLDLRRKNGGILSMRMQVILDSTLDSSFARPGSAPTWGGKKGEFRDWTTYRAAQFFFLLVLPAFRLPSAIFFIFQPKIRGEIVILTLYRNSFFFFSKKKTPHFISIYSDKYTLQLITDE